ncbi:hypothetical protein Pint_26650 [Pistacia integerrima]|uniref:Uncharacterized protein n=1 Tax=Pistacia integerrima TaxID=434235 RepID=A0ACC0YT97_9ROSI|nr:hypothetical protein Pint_26650 [Pistacia integerrima]
MCFDLGYKIKRGSKNARVKESKGEDERKGLLYIEIEKWKKQQEMFNQGSNAASTLSNHHLSNSKS